MGVGAHGKKLLTPSKIVPKGKESVIILHHVEGVNIALVKKLIAPVTVQVSKRLRSGSSAIP